MGEFILPASPSWYCSRVSDCTDQGLFLFGAKNCVYILDVSAAPPRYAGHFVAHSERVVGLSAARTTATGGRRVVTVGDDRVRVWDFSQLPANLVDEHGNHKTKTTTVDWSAADDDVVVSGDEKGSLVVWSLSRGDVKHVALEKSAVFCLQCSPHNRFHVAVGYKSGLILIVDISGHGVVMHRLRGHDDEIHCVVWCPVLGEDIRQRTEDGEAEEVTFTEGCLLASGSRDRSLRVWSTARGRCLLSQKVPSVAARRERYDDQKVRVWLTLLWVLDKPHTLISSSPTGDLLTWDLRRPGKQKYDVITPSSTTRGHQRIVFNLSSPGVTTTETLVSISMDRQIMVWDLKTLAVTVIPTLGGFPYCLSQSPVNPGRLAVGVGDNMIRVWNTVNPNNPYDCSTLWQGLKSKVTTLCWHPYKEGWLAFGTDDGRVGIYDVLSAKPPRVSSTYHRKTVYVVTWGPTCRHGDGDAASFVVYSCGDGSVLVHDPGCLSDDAASLHHALYPPPTRSIQRSEISWKHDFSAVALGNEDGSIEVYVVPGFRLAVTLQVHRKLMNVIRWHPAFSGGGQSSPCHNWIATGSNESTIHIFNLDAYLNGESSSVPLVTDSLIRLEGHSNRITGLAWSPHADGLLVSASYDGTAQVWKLRPCVTPIANFRGHSGRLFSVAWSTEDDDVIYSGADDFCLMTWRISAQAHTTPPIGAEKKKKTKTKNKPKIKSLESANRVQSPEPPSSANSSEFTVSQVSELQMLLEKKRLELSQSGAGDTAEGATVAVKEGDARHQPAQFHSVSPGGDAELDVEEKVPVKKEIRDHKKKRSRSMFPVFSTGENRRKALLHDDCINLARLVCDPADGVDVLGGDQNHLGMYVPSRRHMYDLVQREVTHHAEQGSQEQRTLLDVWSGDVSTLLQTAADRGQLNDWLMALAPSVSPRKWRQLCERYANQLQLEGHVTKAASFLLSAGKTYEAINLLTQHKLFKEAVSLARLRLSPHDPMLEDLYVTWAEHLTNDVCHEQAAKCYLAVGRPLEAAKCLSRRTDLSALRAAVEITRLANEKTAFTAYGHKYIQECQLRGDWSAALDVIEMDHCFKNLALTLFTHEILVRQLTALDLYKGHDLEKSTSALTLRTELGQGQVEELPKFLLNPECVDTLCPWPVTLVEGEPAILHLIRTWLRHKTLDLRSDSLNALYLQLATVHADQQRHSTGKQMLLDLALDVTLGGLCLLLSNTNMAAHWWVVAMETCQQTGSVEILQGLCRLLLPQGRSNLDLLQQQVIALRMVVSDDLTASSPLPVSKGRSKFQMPSTTACDTTNEDVISSEKQSCSVADCLSAFYCLAVLNHWMAKVSILKQTEGVNQSGVSHPVTSDDTQIEDNVVTGSEEATTGVLSKGKGNIPSREKIFTLCRGLLFDIQVKHNRLLAMLDEIEKVANEKHYALQSLNDKPEEMKEKGEAQSPEAIPKRLLSCSSLPMLRTISGEYLNMETGEELDGQGHQRKTSKPQNMWCVGASTDEEEDEECIMRESKTPDSSPKKSLDTNGTVGQGECVDGLNSPTVTVTPATDSTANSGCGDVTAEEGEQVVDRKYREGAVSVRMLEDDQAWASRQLREMSAFVTSYPFPDPIGSADLLLQFLRNLPEGVSIFDLVLKWAKANAFLSNHLDMLDKYKP